MSIRFLTMSNELPRLADASGALASRFVVLTMENSFYGKEDRGLFARLVKELPAILKWALVGFERLQQRGYFLQPESATDALEELEVLGSPVGAFVKEMLVVEAGRRASVEDVFDARRRWCEANGRKEPGTVQSFGRDLRAAVPGLKSTNLRTGDVRARYYEGAGLDQDVSTREPLDW